MKKILIANRGAAAARILRAVKALGLRSVAVYSEADAELPYLRQADERFCIGPAPARDSYLNQDALLGVMARCGADALHPGYGFLSENAAFARRVAAAGHCFIGPSPEWIDALGNKAAARALMQRHGLPAGGSTGILPRDDLAAVGRAAEALGFPVLIKPAGGGGGIGMVPVEDARSLPACWERASGLAEKAFGDASLYLERFIQAPRHIEFQFLADRYGNVLSLFERDCSTQRRYQKVIEEAPAPSIDRKAVADMADRLSAILGGLGYDVIGTVEMLYTPEGGFSFLEVNTRLQVEHAISEAVTGVDIVQAQIRLAAGETLSAVVGQKPVLKGHAIEARVYAEDPVRFLPSPGVLKTFELPGGRPGLRVETGYAAGNRVSSHYDPMVAKIIAHSDTREAATRELIGALENTRVEGIKTNIPMILQVLRSERFQAGAMTVDGLQALISTEAIKERA
ncbi:MAG: ATP-grasp domain-containing protein [Achromobacter sp.]|uniref:acetyl-CoA carboxylase biotin carboxylase subunit n=1 Tax=Achromobacter sp. TaxID=134375 RepID=UPI00258A50D5|nr:biotin carboxylase N-terminal domain-containing protein [Achromobacter sp.]MCW0211007.1 ATP-grasp domain-containing protein [Achromobacter sp.]